MSHFIMLAAKPRVVALPEILWSISAAPRDRIRTGQTPSEIRATLGRTSSRTFERVSTLHLPI